MKFDILIIKYPQGLMKISIEKFFPCSIKKAKQLQPLMRYCEADAYENLIDFLQENKVLYENASKIVGSRAFDYPANSKECKEYTQMFKKDKALANRYARNIEIFEEGRC